MLARLLTALVTLALTGSAYAAEKPDDDTARRVKVALALAAAKPDQAAAERKAKVSAAIQAKPVQAKPADAAPPCPSFDYCPEPGDCCMPTASVTGLWPSTTIKFSDADLSESTRKQLRAAGVAGVTGSATVVMSGITTARITAASVVVQFSPGLEVKPAAFLGTQPDGPQPATPQPMAPVVAQAAAPAVIPPGMHAHRKTDGTVLIHGNDHRGDPNAHAGVSPPWVVIATEGQPVPAAAPVYQSAPVAQAGCPNGQCPTARTYVPATGIFGRRR